MINDIATSSCHLTGSDMPLSTLSMVLSVQFLECQDVQCFPHTWQQLACSKLKGYRASSFMSSSVTPMLVRPGFSVLEFRVTFAAALGATQAMVSSAMLLPASQWFCMSMCKNCQKHFWIWSWVGRFTASALLTMLVRPHSARCSRKLSQQYSCEELNNAGHAQAWVGHSACTISYSEQTMTVA